MAERIESSRVLDSDSVGSVHPATTYERLLDVLPSSIRAVAAALGAIGVFAVSVIVLFSENPGLKDFKTGAWALISGLAGACISHLFGERKE